MHQLPSEDKERGPAQGLPRQYYEYEAHVQALCSPSDNFLCGLYAVKLVGKRETRLSAVTAAISVSPTIPSQLPVCFSKSPRNFFEPRPCLDEAAMHSAFYSMREGTSQVQIRLSGGQGEGEASQVSPGGPVGPWICKKPVGIEKVEERV